MYQVVHNQGLYPKYSEPYLIIDDTGKVHIREIEEEKAVRHCNIMNRSRPRVVWTSYTD